MTKNSVICLYAFVSVAVILAAAPADAQFARRSVDDPATGEQYRIEGTVGLWSPNAKMTIASAGSGNLSGIPGTDIDAKRDLGLTNKKFGEIHVVLRPARKQKFRFEFIPMTYHQEQLVPIDIVFNGQRYTTGQSVESTLQWRAYRFAYEYDFISRNRGFGGFILDAKYTDVRATLDSPRTDHSGECVRDLPAGDPSQIHEFVCGRAPIPAIGGIVRVYVVPNISITGELTGIKVPLIKDKYKAHYADLAIYGTVNFVNSVGVQLGYRSIDVGYLANGDSGSFVLKGIYFGGVVRY